MLKYEGLDLQISLLNNRMIIIIFIRSHDTFDQW